MSKVDGLLRGVERIGVFLGEELEAVRWMVKLGLSSLGWTVIETSSFNRMAKLGLDYTSSIGTIVTLFGLV